MRRSCVAASCYSPSILLVSENGLALPEYFVEEKNFNFLKVLRDSHIVLGTLITFMPSEDLMIITRTRVEQFLYEVLCMDN